MAAAAAKPQEEIEPSSIVGILALQGDFAAHAETLAERGVPTRLVRRPGELDGLAALVLPGGESSVMLRLAHSSGLVRPLVAALTSGIPVLATCAGLILLAREVEHPQQESLGLLDVSVERNGYGRQVHSGVHRIRGSQGFPDCEGVFIRAPRICRVGANVDVLATWEADPVLVRRGPILAASFHPELSAAHPVLSLFLASIAVKDSSGSRP